MKFYIKPFLGVLFFVMSWQLSGQTPDSIPSVPSKPDSLQLEMGILKQQVAAQQDKILEYEEVLKDYATILQQQQQQQQSENSADLSKDDTLSFLRQFIKQLLTQGQPDFSARIHAFQNSFDAYVVDTRQRQVQFYLNDKKGKNYKSLGNLKDELESQKRNVHFATNGGMYTPRLTPQGLYIEDGVIVQPLDTLMEAYGNFYLQPNGVFYLTKEGVPGIVTAAMYDTIPQEIAFATQSGPMLVVNGEHHPVFTLGSKNKYIRSGVGVIDEHHLVFIISENPVNFHDFATLFVDYFQCQQALYLDGAISQTYLPSLNRLQLGGSFGPIIGITSK